MGSASMSGEDLAELLRNMADRVQHQIDDSTTIRNKLRDVVAKLEDEHGGEDA
jgi:hypothetical protein